MSGIEKYIDLEQFPKNKDGKIAWGNCVGRIFDFMYDGEWHKFNVTKQFNTNHLSGIIDDMICVEKIANKNVAKAMFGNYLRKVKFVYNVGDVVNDTVLILDKYTKPNENKNNRSANIKMYKCKCLVDGYEWHTTESIIKNGSQCPLCGKNIMVSGRNDVATLRPDLVCYFKNKDEAKITTEKSNKRFDFVCPICGTEKNMVMSHLSTYGFSCPMCSDGVSYPNKFARNMFYQLSEQYDYYEYEWSPEWAGRYAYDNYIELKDGRKIVVEMDGGFHYNRGKRFSKGINDDIKNSLAKQNNVDVIRINCDYGCSPIGRFEYIKSNIINGLGEIFDFGEVIWEDCNHVAITSDMLRAIEVFNDNKNLTYREMSNIINMKTSTFIGYLKRGMEVGLCNYERSHSAKPVYVENTKTHEITIFRSPREVSVISDMLLGNKVGIDSIRTYCRLNKTVKNYIFRYATIEEYEEFVEKEKQQTA